MKKLLLILLIMTVWLTLNGHDKHDQPDLNKIEKSKIQKNLKFDNDNKSLEIDNVYGKVTITGYKGNVLKLNILKTIKAETDEILLKAKNDVRLDISNEDGKIRLYVDGPFRNKENRRCGWNIERLGYIVKYDMDIKVPEKVILSVKTVTNGNIDIYNITGKCKVQHANGKIYIKNLNGDFNISTANGKIEVIDVDGSGSAHTANGKVYVKFTKNPDSDCDFKTVNGRVDLRFLPGLSGKFNLKTFHGKILSDFPFEYLQAKQMKGYRKNGRFVYKSNQFKSINIGKGGPSISMETLNGSLIIGKGE